MIFRHSKKGHLLRKVKDLVDSPFLIFVAFFFVMFLQQRFIYIYHDDYGFPSLSYVYVVPHVNGTDYNISQLAEFLIKFYNLWGGRILPFFLESLILRKGFWLYRLFQSVILTSIFIVVERLVHYFNKDSSSRKLVALLLCCYYALIDIELHRNGTYWASAAATYIWPLFFLFSAIYLHEKIGKRKITIGHSILIGILYFSAVFSNEQVGLIAGCFLVAILFKGVWFRRSRAILANTSFSLISAVIGYILLIFSPGNQARNGNQIYASFRNLNTVDKILYNFPSVVSINFGHHNFDILFLWILLCAFVMYMACGQKNSLRPVNKILFLFCVFFCVVLIAANIPIFEKAFLWISTPSLTLPYVFFWIIFAGVAVYSTVSFTLLKGYDGLLIIFFGGVISQLVMLLSPSLNIRSSLIFLFALFPILSVMAIEVVKQFIDRKLVRVAIALLLLSAGLNTTYIIRGYSINSPIMEKNHHILSQVSQNARKNDDAQEIELRKLPNDLFAGEMPYSQGFGYIEVWIKEYYDLPSDVELIWR